MTEPQVLSERYRLLGHLGRGGMGDVFRAEDLLLGRKVAIKILHQQFARDDKFVARFRREAQAPANLSHPNIVSIFDWGEDNGTYYMVMELIEGRTLRDIRRSEGPLLSRRAAEIAADAAGALSVAHAAGVFHRDVKPGNIMLTTEGAVKVTDFGIARALDDSEELTRTGAVIGTATYFSPEQAQGVPADERSDVYSLGVVLYELLCGQPPFTGESPVAVAYQHVSEYPTSMREINADVPPELEVIVSRAMEKDPAARYQTADALRAELLLYLRGEFVIATPTPFATADVSADAATELMTSRSATPRPVHAGRIEVEDRRSNITYIVSIVGLLGALAVGILLLSNLLSGDPPTPISLAVPALDGLEKDTAFVTLQDLNLKVRQRDQTSDAVPAGFIIGTDPAGGTMMQPGDFVTVIVSTGPQEFTLPNVVGDTEESARSRITANGFAVGEVSYARSDSVDSGIVIRQTPAPGSADQGTVVALEVSTGPFALTMPQVTGLAQESALRTLSDQSFNEVDVVKEFSLDVLEGFVMRTNPASGQLVPKGNTVQLFVSKGPEPFAVPNLAGMAEQEARDTLSGVGLVLTVGEPTDVSAASGLNGVIASQDPAGGTNVVIGDEVTVSVGQLIRVGVPDLTAMTLDEAEAALASRGLSMLDSGFVEPDPALGLEGRIAQQDPEPGLLRPDGSSVRVWVGLAQVPQLVGVDLAQAELALLAIGLIPGDAGAVGTDDIDLDGVVAALEPEPLTWWEVGTQINITVFVFEPPPTTTTTITAAPTTTAP
jgi:beta-lactam-binding protein with PASTA domain